MNPGHFRIPRDGYYEAHVRYYLAVLRCTIIQAIDNYELRSFKEMMTGTTNYCRLLFQVQGL